MKNLVENIKLSEGFKSRVYQCTQGYDTIGFGFAIKDLVMSKAVADLILEEKLEDLVARLSSYDFFINSPDEIREVLAEMAYQMGVGGLLKFKKTLKMVADRDYRQASVEMLDSLWAKQTPNRAKRLASIVREHG